MNYFCRAGIQINTKLIQHKAQKTHIFFNSSIMPNSACQLLVLLPQPKTIMWYSIISRILGEPIYGNMWSTLNNWLQKVFQWFSSGLGQLNNIVKIEENPMLRNNFFFTFKVQQICGRRTAAGGHEFALVGVGIYDIRYSIQKKKIIKKFYKCLGKYSVSIDLDICQNKLKYNMLNN